MRTNSALLEKVISMEPRLPCPEIFTGVPNCLASTLEIFLYCGEEGFLAGAAGSGGLRSFWMAFSVWRTV